MDEPLAALDAQRKAEVLPYLEQLQRLEPDSVRTRSALARIQPADAQSARERMADVPDPPDSPAED